VLQGPRNPASGHKEMKRIPSVQPRQKPKLPINSGVPEGPNDVRFPIIGIGASAGGLEALEQLLGNTPAGCGMAFVIIQHLDPTNKVVIPFADITAARGARKRKTMQDPDG
jgi:chemotaxis response regulator CheB